MARSEQLGDVSEEADKKKKEEAAEGRPAQAEAKKSLFERLGGERGLTSIVDDFTPRVLADPRVNWQRRSVKRGIFRRAPEVAWSATPQNVTRLKKHLIQFLALATGGPARYEGKEMEIAHHGMRITNPEFDAVVGDLKATLDKLKIANAEQKELLAIVESTRPQIVTVR
jgi:hemoglobin